MAEDGPPTKKGRRPRGPALSAERVLDEAMRLIDESGLDAFSFRILAGRLGCQAMSIYNYFPSKAQLYEALVDRCIAQSRVAFPPGLRWQDKLERVSFAYRQVALNHPGFFPYFATFRKDTRTGLAFLEGVLNILEETGLNAEGRARCFRILSYFIEGAAMNETQGHDMGPSAATPVPPEEARRDFPAIMAVGPYFAPDHQEAVFRFGLQVLIRGIEAEVLRSRPQGRSGS